MAEQELTHTVTYVVLGSLSSDVFVKLVERAPFLLHAQLKLAITGADTPH